MAGKPATRALVSGTRKPKHIPQRTCVGCRAVLAKRTMMRVVRRADDGVVIDPSGKLAGRGAYLHNQRSCWERGLKGSLANALKTTLTTEDRQRLEEYMSSLPADDSAALTGASAPKNAGTTEVSNA